MLIRCKTIANAHKIIPTQTIITLVEEIIEISPIAITIPSHLMPLNLNLLAFNIELPTPHLPNNNNYPSSSPI